MTQKLRVEIDGKGIVIRTPGYDPALVSNIKQMLPKPVRWLPTQQVWKAPLLWDTCVALRQVAQIGGYGVDIGPDLLVWATAEKVRIASIPDPNAQDVDLREFTGVLEADYPQMWAALTARPFQKVGVRYIATTRAALIADQPGLGKTLQTIGGIVEAGVAGPVLIVAAPKSAATLTWPQELAKWVPGEPVIQINGDMKPAEREAAVEEVRMTASCLEDETPAKRVWVVTSPEYIRITAKLDRYGNYEKVKGKKVLVPGAYAQSGLFEIEWRAVVADESHKTLAVGTLNRKKWSAQRIGMELLTLQGDPLKVAISGTPFRGKEENAFGTAHWLLPQAHNSFWRWAEKHFVIFSDPSGFGGQEIGELIDEAGFYEWAKTFMIRRTKEEVAPDLPPKIYAGEPLEVALGQAKMPVPPENLPEEAFADWYSREVAKLGPVAVWLPMKGTQAKQYKRLADDAVIQFEETTLTVNGVFAETTRFRQMACSAGALKEGTFYPTLPSNKFDWCVDFLKDRGLDKDTTDQELSKIRKIIIVSQFTKLLDLFREELTKLGISVHILTGATSNKKRLSIQSDWNENVDSPYRVLLGNIVAMGASITLDAMCDDIITLDETWMKDDEEQAADRIHRLSNTDHSVTIWNLRSLGSYEEGLARRTMSKEDDIKGSIDGARGVEFRRLILPRG